MHIGLTTVHIDKIDIENHDVFISSARMISGCIISIREYMHLVCVDGQEDHLIVKGYFFLKEKSLVGEWQSVSFSIFA